MSLKELTIMCKNSLLDRQLRILHSDSQSKTAAESRQELDQTHIDEECVRMEPNRLMAERNEVEDKVRQ